jgi:hypothetical protein
MYLEGLPDGGEKILYGMTSEGDRIVVYGFEPWPDLTLGDCGACSDPSLGLTCNRPADHDGRHAFIEYQADGSVEHRYFCSQEDSAHAP